MSAKAWLGAMVAGSVLVLVVGARRDPGPPPETPRPPLETPWLTQEAAAEIVAPGGGLGPLFAGVTLGGLAPSPTVRAHIAEFARAHNVDIKLEIVDDEVAAVRFEVMYGGCCGYEGADALGRRLGRPKTDSCCGCDEDWIDDWAMSAEDGVHVRARVRVNRVSVRWEPELTLDGLVARADALLGADRVAVAKAAGDRWFEIEPNRQYQLDVPYAFDKYRMLRPGELGLQIVAAAGKIVEVSFTVRSNDDDGERRIAELLRSHWGRPRVNDESWTWRKRDRLVSAEVGYSSAAVTIRAR